MIQKPTKGLKMKYFNKYNYTKKQVEVMERQCHNELKWLNNSKLKLMVDLFKIKNFDYSKESVDDIVMNTCWVDMDGQGNVDYNRFGHRLSQLHSLIVTLNNITDISLYDGSTEPRLCNR